MYSVELRWQNFRPFIDTGWIAIKPITVLIGPNNSGKSSVLAPLLILNQTLRSGRARSPLVLRGDLINAGGFSDIVNSHDSKKRVTFSVRFRNSSGSEAPPELGEDAPAECSLTFKAERAAGVIGLHNYSVSDSYGRTMLSRTKKNSSRYTLDGIEAWATDPEQRVSSEDDVTASPSNRAAEKAVREAMPFHFLFRSRNVMTEAARAASGEPVDESVPEDEGSDHADKSWTGEPRSLQVSPFVVGYVVTTDMVEHYMREHVLDLVYLGPLREAPQRLYEISGDAPSDVGIRGQFSAELLLRNQRRSIFNRVDRWLKEFGLEGKVVCRAVTEAAFVLELKTDTATTNFADVGFGYSQLLPLIVQGLLAQPDTLVIAEQPEIHLNPRLQAKLAGLFQEITKRDVALLVETHSEHLLLALRRLVAEGALRSDDVAIYFVEATSDQGSHIREVPLQSNGHIEPTDWPKNFFDESLRESLALASAQARRGLNAQ